MPQQEYLGILGSARAGEQSAPTEQANEDQVEQLQCHGP
jgi:hypothetical protein